MRLVKMKKTGRFSFLISLYLFLIILIFSIIMLIWTYGTTRYIVDQEIKNIFKHQSTIAGNIISHEMELIAQILKCIAHDNEIHQRIGQGKSGDWQKSLSQKSSFFLLDKLALFCLLSVEGDLLHYTSPFLPYNKTLFRDRINPAFKEFQKQNQEVSDYLFLSLFPSDNQKKKAVLVKLLPLYNKQNGSLQGYLLGGLLLNDNLKLLNRVKSETGTDSVSLFYQNEMIVSTKGHQSRINTFIRKAVDQLAAGEVLDCGSSLFWPDEALMVAYHYLSLKSDSEDLKIAFATRDLSLKKLHRNYQLTIILLPLFSLLFFIMTVVFVRLITLPSLSKLLNYSDLVSRGYYSSRYQDGIISEFNILGHAMEEMVIHLKEINTQLHNEIDQHKQTTCEKEKIQQQLTQTQKMEIVGSLAGGLAHDFNNVLGGIIGTVSLLDYILQNEEADKNYIKEQIDIIRHSADNAAEIVQHLLGLARKHQLSMQTVDLLNTVDEVIKICHRIFDKSIEIELRMPVKSALVFADHNYLEQAILNICVNASHAMTIMRKPAEKQGGVLAVQLKKILADKDFCRLNTEALIEQAYWKLEISDTGVGMNQATLQNIFHPYFTTKRKDQGTGLGLSMAYSVIKQHSGFIDVSSEIGKGTSVCLFLPVLEKETGLDSDLGQRELFLASGTVLIIDDEEIIRKTLWGMLSKMGFNVMAAEDPEEGIRLFENQYEAIHLLILDISMPKMSGKEVYQHIRRIKPQQRVILVSGYARDRRVEEALEMGANCFLQKPFSIYQLSEAIRKVLTLK